jgi:hypothetical protein
MGDARICPAPARLKILFWTGDDDPVGAYFETGSRYLLPVTWWYGGGKKDGISVRVLIEDSSTV